MGDFLEKNYKVQYTDELQRLTRKLRFLRNEHHPAASRQSARV
jgi:DnaJ-domain-containing protein 1